METVTAIRGTYSLQTQVNGSDTDGDGTGDNSR